MASAACVRGVVIALYVGATRGCLLRDVAMRGTLLAASGCALGLACARAAGHVLEARLFEVTPMDFVAHGSAVLLVMRFSVGASVAPARRAMGASALSVLRSGLS